MRFHTSTTRYHCGIDLHSRQMYVCVMDSQGDKLLHMNIRNNDFEFFLRKIAPWRHDMTVCCECLFCWYWLADACEEAGLEFVLAHALYLKAIHGGKNKNDRIDSEKLAHLLRGVVERMPTWEGMGPRLAGLRVPTCIVSGGADPGSLAAGRRLAGRIPGSRHAVVPDAGHIVNLENVQEFNRVLEEFLAELPVSEPGSSR